MTNWKKEIEPADEDSPETEVHRLELKLILINVSQEKGETDWEITLMNTVDYTLICPQEREPDLTKALVRSMAMAIGFLEADAKVLAETMLDIVGPGPDQGATEH